MGKVWVVRLTVHSSYITTKTSTYLVVLIQQTTMFNRLCFFLFTVAHLLHIVQKNTEMYLEKIPHILWF